MSNNQEPYFSLRDIRYLREGEHAIDNIHLLSALSTGSFDYALPTDSSDITLRLVHFLFSSLNEDDEFDKENFQALLGKLKDTDGLTMKSLIRDEFLATDFMVCSAFKAHKSIDDSLGKIPPVNLGRRASMIILQRVLGSFQSVAILIKYSMFFDVNCLLRSILEQIGHAYQIRHAKDSKEIDSFTPSRSITPLKEVISEAGTAYGMLTDYIHNNKNIWGEYVESEQGEDGVHRTYVVTRSGVRTKACIVTFSYIVKAYLSILVDVYTNHCDGVESDFVYFVSDCRDHISKLMRDMEDQYFSEPEAKV